MEATSGAKVCKGKYPVTPRRDQERKSVKSTGNKPSVASSSKTPKQRTPRGSAKGKISESGTIPASTLLLEALKKIISEPVTALRKSADQVYQAKPISVYRPSPEEIVPDISVGTEEKKPTLLVQEKEVSFRFPTEVNLEGLDIDNLEPPHGCKPQGSENRVRKFSFAQRLQEWRIGRKMRFNGRRDMFYHHKMSRENFRSLLEVIEFIMYEVSPRGRKKTTKEEEEDEEEDDDNGHNELVESCVNESTEEYPINKPAEEYPINKPAEEYPINKPAEEYSIRESMEESRINEPVEEYHIKNPAEEYHIKNPAEEYHIKNPAEYHIKNPAEVYPINEMAEEYRINELVEEYRIDESEKEYHFDKLTEEYRLDEPMEAYHINELTEEYPINKLAEEYRINKPTYEYLINEPAEEFRFNKATYEYPINEPEQYYINKPTEEYHIKELAAESRKRKEPCSDPIIIEDSPPTETVSLEDIDRMIDSTQNMETQVSTQNMETRVTASEDDLINEVSMCTVVSHIYEYIKPNMRKG